MTGSDATIRTRLEERIFESSETLRQIAGALEVPGSHVLVGRARQGPMGLVLASLTRRLQRPILLVTSGSDEAERARRDWASFLGDVVREFPPWESLFDAESEPDPDTYAQRTEVEEAFRAPGAVAAVAPIQALVQPVARRAESRDQRFVLRPGDYHPTQELARALVDAGYRRFPQVARPGDFSIRGGIFDVYPREASHPYRVEFFGNEVESIRAVSIQDQRSRDEVPLLSFHVLPKSEYFVRGYTGAEVTLLDRLPDHTIVALASPGDVQERCESLIRQWETPRAGALAGELWTKAGRLTRLDLEPLPPEPGRRPVNLPVQSTEAFRGNLDRVVDVISEEADRGTEIRLLFRNEAEVERFGEILTEAGVGSSCSPDLGELSTGFRWEEPEGGIFLAGGEILGRTRTLSRRARRVASARAVDSFVELEVGDLVVHVTHGIGRFRGVRELRRGARSGDHLVIEFREGVHLLVPAERIDLIQKYVGGGLTPGRLDKIGGKSWARRKARAESAVHDLAAEMLEMQALRAEKEGYAFPADTDWQREFEDAFPFEDTADQRTTTEAIKSDLERPRPMDRLVCGDVGYGKTELAMRAAFKVVRDGKQVAVLVPTTVLAQQHLITFHDRMAEFPVQVEAVSRFRTRKEQGEILRKAAEGELDVLIGTHRILSADVSFEDLGLIIIDEEQRFGVAHKEKLKQLRRMVDVLTLTATPIPRTLHMSLMGARDISSLNEAPEGRRSIQSEVSPFDPARFRKIILRELNRDGQVFWVHNRVRSIEQKARELQSLVPEANILFVHGQMPEHDLEDRMGEFLEKQCNLLVTTTIIESGLDIPSVNTIIIERADMFGLAELHQLRGRVGRGRHQAYAYFLLPDDRPVAEEGRKRLEAVEELSQLGAGFQIAMRDLEIRGAGNILGREQSGHIATIGYDLYCRLLERVVAELRGQPSREPPDVEVAISGHCQIPEEYIGDLTSRLRIYRAIAAALDEDTVREIEESLPEQYGEIPEETRNLLRVQLIRIRLGRWGARRAATEDGWLVMEGATRELKAAFEKLGWDAVDLPDPGTMAARPDCHSRLTDLDSVFGALAGSSRD